MMIEPRALFMLLFVVNATLTPISTKMQPQRVAIQSGVEGSPKS